jgi:thioredoxin reductase
MTTEHAATPPSDSLLDAIIVGGGPAGLAAALLLGRCRRRVLICDTGHPRNAASHALHGYLTRDGIAPAEFLRIGREQLQPYETVEFRNAEVCHVEREGTRFTAFLGDGARMRARALLLASGVVDVLPPLEGLRDFYGTSVHHCPYCDGWEHRDQTIAVLGGDEASADLALEMRLWTRHIVLCTNGAPSLSAERLKHLQNKGIAFAHEPIARLEGEAGQLAAIQFRNGAPLACDALFFVPSQAQRSPLAEKLGCKFCEDEKTVDCGDDSTTSVPGVFVAGNSARGLQLVIMAAASGTQAGCSINNWLLETEAEK